MAHERRRYSMSSRAQPCVEAALEAAVGEPGCDSATSVITIISRVRVTPKAESDWRPSCAATVVGSDRALALNVERAGSLASHGKARNRFVTHFNAFTRIAIVPNLVPWFAPLSPVSEIGHKHRRNRFFRLCVVWPPKNTTSKRLCGSFESESAYFLEEFLRRMREVETGNSAPSFVQCNCMLRLQPLGTSLRARASGVQCFVGVSVAIGDDLLFVCCDDRCAKQPLLNQSKMMK